LLNDVGPIVVIWLLDSQIYPRAATDSWKTGNDMAEVLFASAMGFA
jgi:hypothetical protein